MNVDRTVAQPRPHFLVDPPPTREAQALAEEELEELGFVMNATRLWGYAPAVMTGLFDLMSSATALASLTFRDRGILVAATASTLGDSYCSLAWGTRLAGTADPATVVGIFDGDDTNLTAGERSMARWARRVVTDPSATRFEDVESLRRAGFSDEQVFAITVYVALRIAFSTVNASLGAAPDAELDARAPESVRSAISYGRAAQTSRS